MTLVRHRIHSQKKKKQQFWRNEKKIESMKNFNQSVDDQHADQTEKKSARQAVFQIRPELESMLQWTDQSLLSNDQIGHTAEQRQIPGDGRQKGQM